jgi:hypothetical protein
MALGVQMNHAERIANFERIEQLMRDGKFQSMPIKEVKVLRQSLLADAPTSDNPQFVQRLQRVESALAIRVSETKHWWSKPFGVIALRVIGGLIAAAAVYYLGLK